MCDPLVIIYECFVYAYMLYEFVWSETVNCCICSFQLSKPLFKFFIHGVFIPNVYVRVAEVLNYLGISFLCQFGGFLYV